MGIFTKYLDNLRPSRTRIYYRIKLIEKIREINDREVDKKSCNRIFDEKRWCLEFVDKKGNIIVLNNKGELLYTLSGQEISKSEAKQMYINHELKLNKTVDAELLQYVNGLDPYYIQQSHLNVIHQDMVVIRSMEEKRREAEKDYIKVLMNEINTES